MKSYKNLFGWSKKSTSSDNRRKADKQSSGPSTSSGNDKGSTKNKNEKAIEPPAENPTKFISNFSAAGYNNFSIARSTDIHDNTSSIQEPSEAPIPPPSPLLPPRNNNNTSHTNDQEFYNQHQSHSSSSTSLPSSSQHFPSASTTSQLGSNMPFNASSVPVDATSIASSAQSSIFSHTDTAGTRSTAPSSRYSGKRTTSVAVAEAPKSAALMRVVETEQYSPLEQDGADLKKSNSLLKKEKLKSSQPFYARQGAVAHHLLMSDMALGESSTTALANRRLLNHQSSVATLQSLHSNSNNSHYNANPINNNNNTSNANNTNNANNNKESSLSVRPSSASSISSNGISMSSSPVPAAAALSHITHSPPPPPPPPPPTQQHYSSLHLAASITTELKRLEETLLIYLDQANNGIADIGVLAGYVSNSFVTTLAAPSLQNVPEGYISVHSEPAISTIIKIVLHFVDNLLRPNPLHRQKGLLLQKLYFLGVQLKILPAISGSPLQQPKNFAVGSIPELPSEKHIQQILDAAASHASDSTQDQSGAFIAPVLRGLAPDFSVISLIFGYPDLRQDHIDQIVPLADIRPDVHFCCQKNYVTTCASLGVGGTPGVGAFRSPFRMPLDPRMPPISMSLSRENNPMVSGTLGGYIYPQVDSGNTDLGAFGKSTFAITCAHVCLESETGENMGAPVAVPSTHLSSAYRRALLSQSDRFRPGSVEHETYRRAIKDLDRKTAINHSPGSFGQVVWGERAVIGKQLSDVAIIQCNEKLQCRNYLGDDVAFSEYDPALMFGNLYVRSVVEKPIRGMEVFKYGSTTKYTHGQLNGLRMIYWSDGKLQSSEFVVSSNSPGFASGGDSGAWILHKDCGGNAGDYVNDNRSGPSLGVVGMLHSFDGERQEFGLYTPMTSILSRLQEVTNIKWGVVGIPDTHGIPAGGSDSSEDELDRHHSD